MAQTIRFHSPRRRSAPSAGRVVVATLLVVLAIVVMPPTGAAAHAEYVVQPGDSLSTIAQRHGVSVSSLAADNGISNLHLIRVGQVLRIPHNGNTSYVVKSGDTLSEIAASAGVSTRQLIDANGLSNPDVLRVGQKLTLPAGAAVATANPAAGYNNLPSKLRANPDRLALIPSFERWSNHYGVPADLVMAVAYRESGWQTQVVSPKGAIGVGQILPRTADWIAGELIGLPDLDPYDPDDNIRMSARFLAWLIGYMGSVDAAMAGYYQGPGSVAARGYYDDTQAYIDNVNQIRRLFAKG